MPKHRKQIRRDELEEDLGQRLDKLIERYQELMRTIDRDELNWLLGDLAIEVKHLADQTIGRPLIDLFLEETKLSEAKFRVLRFVSNHFPKDGGLRLLAGIRWSHYRTAATSDDPLQWVQTASEKKWSAGQLQAAIQGYGLEVETRLCRNGCGRLVPIRKRIALYHIRLGGRALFCSWSCLVSFCEPFAKEDVWKEERGPAPSRG